MQSIKRLNSMLGLIKAFSYEEIIKRGWRIIQNRLRNDPISIRFSLLPMELLAKNVEDLFPNLSIQNFITGVQLHAIGSIVERDAIVERIYKGDLTFLGDSGFLFGASGIRWEGIPGFEPWPLLPSHQVPIRKGRDRYGDVLRIWHLNKHAFFVILADKFYRSRDCNDLYYLLNLWQDWIKKNPVGIGVNWSSPLEVAERVINWIVTLMFLWNSVKIEDQYFQNITKSILQHGAFLSAQLTSWSYNHCIGEAAGLLFVSRLVHETEIGRRWHRQAVNTLENRVQRLLTPEGFYKEKSPAYAFLVLQFLTLVTWLLTHKESELIRERVIGLKNFLEQMTTSLGNLPHLGDQSDACILDYTFKQRPFSSHMVLHIGNSVKFSENLEKYSTAIHVPGFEVSVLRSGLLQGLLNVDNAPILGNVAPHIHDDILQVLLWYRGVPLIVDAGTYSYSANPKKREWYRSVEAHNRPHIDKVSDSVQLGIFRWCSLVRGISLGVTTQGTVAVASAQRVDGIIKRHLFIHSRLCLILDRLTFPQYSERNICTTFFFGDTTVSDYFKGWHLILGQYGIALVGHGVFGNQMSIQYKWEKQSYSQRYGVEEEAAAFNIKVNASKPVWAVLVVWIHDSDNTEKLPTLENNTTGNPSLQIIGSDTQMLASIELQSYGVAVNLYGLEDHNNSTIIFRN